MTFHAEFLVRGECDCGWMCACPEGAMWPKCAECGEQVMPPSPPSAGEQERVGSAAAWAACTREGYVAIRMPEQQALDVVRTMDVVAPDGLEPA